MREIKKVEMGQIPNIDSKTPGKAEPQFCGEETEQKVVKDFSNPTEVLGRSQISKADNLKADISFGMANPDAISSSDRFFEIAYAQLSEKDDPHAYEKACAISTSPDARELLS